MNLSFFLKDTVMGETADTMGPLSVSTHTRLVHWQKLLVAASLFNFWCQPTTAQLAIVSTYAAEGKDVILRIHNKPPNHASLLWYKGEGANKNNIIAFLSEKPRMHLLDPAFGRVVLKQDGSLLIKKVTKADAGKYTILVYLTNSRKEIGFGRLTVYEPELVVSLEASNTTVTENKDSVVLTCHTNALFIHWLFQGMNLELKEHMKISKDHQSLTINPVKREDAGIYWCEVSNPVGFNESWPVSLVVKFE
ncbi:carcinoembryonic antigen-related cell adhesion molecule 21-like [Artibeus jamaicensis]|uniref:carcinoembryonic antigen-related cell adhesion molecule 21-like n=1 Tax=Artibeus jamaicensis TaxID=9417 RepID=UPI00235AC3CA|nr:carcinoembryonic antigen-related cell adhesion molecule 21-like [Artibeus jamaicensis]